MITEMDMYWLTRFDHIHNFLVPIAALSLGFGMLSAIGYVVTFDCEEVPPLRNKAGWASFSLLSMSLLVGLVMTFLPTTNEYAAMKVIPAIANNTEVQGLGNDIVDLAKEWVRELKPKSKTEVEKSK